MENQLIKYPRTYHLPWSLGVQSDDKYAKDLSRFKGKRVIISEKMDGENTTMYEFYQSGIHARSTSSVVDKTREWCKAVQIAIAQEIQGLRLCGENMAYIHSIEYDDLISFFYLFSVWDIETNTCLSWDDTIELANVLDLATPKVLYDGIWDEALFEKMYNDMDFEKMEGYTIRLADSFHYNDFEYSLVKAVRPNHVQTDEHWRKCLKPATLSTINPIKPYFMAK